MFFSLLSRDRRLSLHNFAGVPSQKVTVAVRFLPLVPLICAKLQRLKKTELGLGCENKWRF